MAEKAMLDSSLLDTPLSPETRAAITSQLWTCQPADQSLHRPEADLESFWTYYSKECARALHNGGRHVALRTHRDVSDCARKLKGGMLRNDVKTELQANLSTLHANEDEMLDNAIDLAASLLLMMSFSGSVYGFSGRGHLRWDHGHGPLRGFVASYFDDPVADARLAKENVRMDKVFNAHNLCRIAGLQIIWTDNLVDHLRLADDDRRVHVFHHVAFLEVQLRSADSLLPEGLAEETLRTLALLFPSSDAATRRWFSNLAEASSLDKRVIHCGQLKTDHRQTDKFKFWNNRLVTLKQVFDEAQPKSLSQWWHDRRNGVQWYTFWVAVLVLVLTVFFGIVQSIEGALQVYASFKSIQNPG